MTPTQLFTHCGQFLCGNGPKWKEQFAAMLMVKTNTVDNMSKGTSRVPPAMWREIAAYIQDREREAPTLRGAAIAVAEVGARLTFALGAGLQHRLRDADNNTILTGTHDECAAYIEKEQTAEIKKLLP
jgi:hypothetical protein